MNSLSLIVGNQDVVLVSDKQSAPVAQSDDDLGRLAQDGVNESIRYTYCCKNNVFSFSG